MPRALFAVPIENANAKLPPMDGEEICLHYTDDQGVLCGGFWLVGQVPQVPTCLVVVDSSEATIAAMDADDAYLWIEEKVGEPDAEAG